MAWFERKPDSFFGAREIRVVDIARWKLPPTKNSFTWVLLNLCLKVSPS
jgi:hypothetical protein